MVVISDEPGLVRMVAAADFLRHGAPGLRRSSAVSRARAYLALSRASADRRGACRASQSELDEAVNSTLAYLPEAARRRQPRQLSGPGTWRLRCRSPRGRCSSWSRPRRPATPSIRRCSRRLSRHPEVRPAQRLQRVHRRREVDGAHPGARGPDRHRHRGGRLPLGAGPQQPATWTTTGIAVGWRSPPTAPAKSGKDAVAKSHGRGARERHHHPALRGQRGLRRPHPAQRLPQPADPALRDPQPVEDVPRHRPHQRRTASGSSSPSMR